MRRGLTNAEHSRRLLLFTLLRRRMKESLCRPPGHGARLEAKACAAIMHSSRPQPPFNDPIPGIITLF
eukprot:scaffold1699_cov114-Isochrysis_galbana.AAC.12